ncbi:hypothetical protein BCR34DRAFT_170710 [Clohesyomyces aquaticus]|uniref:Uncharacterized protein n=1 Tax=Clohesyomyces aquaticus TaxID=1231657 RepID=A0A1Y1ZZ82_9PLEO|nr:hypothetical protein BCR34DRAFT_170710 [Clohesyomyces aquaticus]
MWWNTCADVHCGFWINWENGAVNGSTLTLPVEWGLVVGGFLALFVKLGGEHLWMSLCFIIHQLKASSKMQDDVHHQSQLVLRNVESEATLIQQLFKIASSHKGARLRAFSRFIPLILLASTSAVFFWAGAGLSSRFITSQEEVVQAIDKSCGWAKIPSFKDLTDDTSFQAASALIATTRHGFRNSVSYAKACYSQKGVNATACNKYIQPTLPYSVAQNASCPFDSKMCKSSTILLDTGHLRTDNLLGFNTKPEDALSFRKIFSCAPLAGENYTEKGWQPIPDDLGANTYAKYVKGYKFGEWTSGSNPGNWTFYVTDAEFLLSKKYYSLDFVTSFVNSSEADKEIPFNPIPELQSSDSDVYVVGLQNRASYMSRIDDPWFNAPNCTEVPGKLIPKFCVPVSPFNFLGCKEQYQFCTADQKSCSPLNGIHGISTKGWSSSEPLTKNQEALFAIIWRAMWASQLNFQLGLLADENLVANDYLWDSGGFQIGMSAALPNNQWETEVRNWMNTSLVAVQMSPLSWAQPEEFDVMPGISTTKYIIPPADEASKQLCKKVKQRSAAHTSFSVLKLFLLFALGLFFIISNLALPKVVATFQRRTGSGANKRLEWIESSTFQLQRMAAEGRGIGPWEGREANVPRLVGDGRRFNLTSESLKGAWSRVDSWEVLGRGNGNGNAKVGDTEVSVDRVELLKLERDERS